MEQRVRQFIDEHHLFAKSDRVLVGLSGGRDSMVLMHILYRLGYDIVCAHCNFHLRGEESNRDAEFVSRQTKELGLPLMMVDFETEEYATEHGLSIEMAARNLRYEWFASLIQQTGCRVTAVAHHRDDVAETFLINMTRGTGLLGLTGIKPKNGDVVRPLLPISRSEIDAFVHSEGIEYVEDSTNKEMQYVRNKFRNVILPQLEEINPSFRSSLMQTISHLQDAQSFICSQLDELRGRYVSNTAEGISIDAELMRHEQSQFVLYEMMKPFGFTASTIADVHRAMASGTATGRWFVSPSGKRAIISRGTIIITDEAIETEHISTQIEAEQTNISSPISMSICEVAKGRFTLTRSADVCSVDRDKLTFPLTIRKAIRGDAFCPFGMKGRKLVSDFFIDSKFSTIQKENTYVLVNGNGDIIWIVGHRADNRFRITDDTSVCTIFTINK